MTHGLVLVCGPGGVWRPLPLSTEWNPHTHYKQSKPTLTTSPEELRQLMFPSTEPTSTWPEEAFGDEKMGTPMRCVHRTSPLSWGKSEGGKMVCQKAFGVACRVSECVQCVNSQGGGRAVDPRERRHTAGGATGGRRGRRKQHRHRSDASTHTAVSVKYTSTFKTNFFPR